MSVSLSLSSFVMDAIISYLYQRHRDVGANIDARKRANIGGHKMVVPWIIAVEGLSTSKRIKLIRHMRCGPASVLDVGTSTQQVPELPRSSRLKA